MRTNTSAAESRYGSESFQSRWKRGRVPPDDPVVRWHLGEFVTGAELRDVERAGWRESPPAPNYGFTGP